MMNKKIRLLFLACLVPTLLLILLYALYRNKQIKLSFNFKRNIKDLVVGLSYTDIKVNSYYLAGVARSRIYFGNSTATSYLLESSSNTVRNLRLTGDSNFLNKNGNYRASVLDGHFFVSNGLDRTITFGNLNDGKGRNSNLYVPYFSQAAPLSTSSVVFRSVGYKSGVSYLRRESAGQRAKENTKLLTKQVDGFFCTDGLLKYDQENKTLVYLYYYRNQILLIDTNLKLIKKIKTIDPVDSAKFKLSTVKSTGSTTFLIPPVMVNRRFFCFNGHIYVHSKVMGRNEDPTLFQTSSVIDIYDLQTGKYRYSFYIPYFKNRDIKDFCITDEGVITLTDHYIVKYKLKYHP